MLGLGLIAIGLLAYNYGDQQYELIGVLKDATPVDKVAIAEARNDILRNTPDCDRGLCRCCCAAAELSEATPRGVQRDPAAHRRLRIQAVAQLGSESPSVRIGGLHNLERLGESHPELRQIVLDEICSYLRLDQRQGADSDTSPDGEPEPDTAQARFSDAESEVRLIALEILQRHLKFRTSAQRTRYWSHTRINLKNAALQDLDLSDCLMNEANFRGAQFRGGTRFGDAQFHVGAHFEGAQFHGYTGFGGAKFHGEASFGVAQFYGGAGFGGAKFHGATNFGDAQFHGDAHFGSAQFHGGGGFVSAQFHGDADFGDAQFHGDAHFEGAQFHGDADFGGAEFHRHARFRDAQFRRGADFEDVQFHKGAGFEGAVGLDRDGQPNGDGAAEDSA